jgi:hypothetical protein
LGSGFYLINQKPEPGFWARPAGLTFLFTK